MFPDMAEKLSPGKVTAKNNDFGCQVKIWQSDSGTFF